MLPLRSRSPEHIVDLRNVFEYLVLPPVHGHEVLDGTPVQLIKQTITLEGLLPGEVEHPSRILDPAASRDIGVFNGFVEPLRVVAPDVAQVC